VLLAFLYLILRLLIDISLFEVLCR